MSNIETNSEIQFANYPDILSINDLQEVLAIGRSKAYQLINSGTIRNWKIGKSIKIPKVFVIEYIVNSCYNGRVVMDSSSQEGG